MSKSCHKNNIVSLKRIEGQIRGIQNMLEEDRYCVDVLLQLRSVIKAIASVKRKIYKKHLETCVTEALHGKSQVNKQEKVDEIIDLLEKHSGV